MLKSTVFGPLFPYERHPSHPIPSPLHPSLALALVWVLVYGMCPIVLPPSTHHPPISLFLFKSQTMVGWLVVVVVVVLLYHTLPNPD